MKGAIRIIIRRGVRLYKQEGSARCRNHAEMRFEPHLALMHFVQ